LRVGQAALLAMRGPRRGHIVNINSLSGLLAIPFEGMYFASKYELEGMTEALRMELRPYG
jgi:short-subunit dehydrogenase